MNDSTSTPLPSQAHQPHRILVVEPDPFLLHLSAEVLIRHGYEVNVAEDAATAWGELQAVKYNLLITGYKLPKLTGIGLIKKLRAARLALPVVLVAEKLPPKQQANLPPLQLSVVLLKPITAEALLDTVESVLRVASSPQDDLAARARTITPLLQEILEHQVNYSRCGLKE